MITFPEILSLTGDFVVRLSLAHSFALTGATRPSLPVGEREEDCLPRRSAAQAGGEGEEPFERLKS